MARSFAKTAMQCLATALESLGWQARVDETAAEVEASRTLGRLGDQVLSFAAIYNKSDAICFQAGVGARLHEINRVIGELRGSNARDLLTAYALVNHLSPKSARRSGWCFTPGTEAELSVAANTVVHEVLAIAEVQSLLSSVVDVQSYIAGVENARWPFVSVDEPYVAALIVAGRVSDAVRVAEKLERSYVETVSARGAHVREGDLTFVRAAQKLLQ